MNDKEKFKIIEHSTRFDSYQSSKYVQKEFGGFIAPNYLKNAACSLSRFRHLYAMVPTKRAKKAIEEGKRSQDDYYIPFIAFTTEKDAKGFLTGIDSYREELKDVGEYMFFLNVDRKYLPPGTTSSNAYMIKADETYQIVKFKNEGITVDIDWDRDLPGDYGTLKYPILKFIIDGLMDCYPEGSRLIPLLHNRGYLGYYVSLVSSLLSEGISYTPGVGFGCKFFLQPANFGLDEVRKNGLAHGTSLYSTSYSDSNSSNVLQDPRVVSLEYSCYLCPLPEKYWGYSPSPLHFAKDLVGDVLSEGEVDNLIPGHAYLVRDVTSQNIPLLTDHGYSVYLYLGELDNKQISPKAKPILFRPRIEAIRDKNKWEPDEFNVVPTLGISYIESLGVSPISHFGSVQWANKQIDWFNTIPEYKDDLDHTEQKLTDKYVKFKNYPAHLIPNKSERDKKSTNNRRRGLFILLGLVDSGIDTSKEVSEGYPWETYKNDKSSESDKLWRLGLSDRSVPDRYSCPGRNKQGALMGFLINLVDYFSSKTVEYFPCMERDIIIRSEVESRIQPTFCPIRAEYSKTKTLLINNKDVFPEKRALRNAKESNFSASLKYLLSEEFQEEDYKLLAEKFPSNSHTRAIGTFEVMELGLKAKNNTPTTKFFNLGKLFNNDLSSSELTKIVQDKILEMAVVPPGYSAISFTFKGAISLYFDDNNIDDWFIKAIPVMNFIGFLPVYSGKVFTPGSQLGDIALEVLFFGHLIYLGVDYSRELDQLCMDMKYFGWNKTKTKYKIKDTIINKFIRDLKDSFLIENPSYLTKEYMRSLITERKIEENLNKVYKSGLVGGN